MPAGARVVVAEEDTGRRERLTRALVARGYEVTEARTLGDLLALLDPAGDEPLSIVVATRPRGDPRVGPSPALSAAGARDLLRELEGGPATDREGDAADLDDARLLVLSASTGPRREDAEPVTLRIDRLRERAAALRAGGPAFDELVGASPPMLKLIAALGQVAASDVSVLITGETGTGKERIAQALHDHGPRRRGPFVAFSCAAMPETLLESELFGHVRGAFTGAQGHEGLLLAANGGTLFLDEIGDAPLGIQRKLLRVLQERRVRPLGSGKEVPFDVRVLAATHRDLRAAIAAGEFREDLFYRLAVVQLEVPPLRARGEDVLLLAQQLLDEHRAAGRAAVRGLTDGAAARLLGYGWPGNVRELKNCIDRAVALARHEWITEADLPATVAAPTIAVEPASILVSLDEVQRTHMLRVLRSVGGNKTLAAHILGCDRRTLYRKLGSTPT